MTHDETMSRELRIATVMDCITILKLLKSVYKATAHILPECEDDTATHWIVETISKGFVVNSVEDGKLIGSIGLELAHYPWNRSAWNYRNAWLAVHPKHRDKGTADALIDAATRHAKERGIPLVIGSNSTENAELKDRYFRQKGFQYLGGDFAIGMGEK